MVNLHIFLCFSTFRSLNIQFHFIFTFKTLKWNSVWCLKWVIFILNKCVRSLFISLYFAWCEVNIWRFYVLRLHKWLPCTLPLTFFNSKSNRQENRNKLERKHFDFCFFCSPLNEVFLFVSPSKTKSGNFKGM